MQLLLPTQEILNTNIGNIGKVGESSKTFH